MMNLSVLTGIVKVGRTFFVANRPEILVGVSVISTVGGAILAAKGGYEARGMVDKAEAEKGAPLEVKEKIQLTWLCYMPAAITVTTAVGSIGGLHLVHVKEKKALATAALAAIEEVKKEAKAFEKELTAVLSPEEKEDVQNRLYEKNVNAETGIAMMKNSDGEIEEFYLVRDSKTGRDIWSNEHRIQESINNVNAWINKHGDCELNTFYSNAGFGMTPDGDDWGWSGTLVEIVWDSTVRDDGRPVRRFAFRTPPQDGFDRKTH